MRDLIVFGEDFGGLPSSTQHLIRGLAADRKIIWINSIGLRQPRLSVKDFKRATAKLFGTRQVAFSPLEHCKNIKVVNLKTIPAPRSKLARLAAKTMLLQQIKPLVKAEKLNEPILWTSLPTVADLCGHLNESAVVYYCGDDFSALAGVDHDTVTLHEKDLVNKSDLILAASHRLIAKFPESKTHYLPHGVDYELFSSPTTMASDLPCNHKPTAGFYGSLSNWLDYDLLSQICRERSDWNFVFIGPLELNHFPLDSLSNVYRLGPRPHACLPSYVQHWNVSMLPFVDNQQIAQCNPLKLLEYLSAGTPVISTRFNAVEPYSHQIDIANSAQQFSDYLDQYHTKTKRDAANIKEQSWNARVTKLKGFLEAL